MQKRDARRAIVFQPRIVLDRKVAYGLLVVIVLAVTAFVGISANVDESGPWHYLQGISKSLSDLTSVDSTGASGVGLGGPNNVIDNADSASSLNGQPPSSFCVVGDTRPGCGTSGGAAGQHAGYCVDYASAEKTCDATAPAVCVRVRTGITGIVCGCQTGWTKKLALVSASLQQSTDGSSLSLRSSSYYFCIKD